MRADFQVTESVSPDEAVRAADGEERGLVVLSDTGDSVFGGGAGGDSTVLIESMLRIGIEGRALVPLVDAAAVARLAAAGTGATVTLALGGGDQRLLPPDRAHRRGPVDRGRATCSSTTCPGREFDMGQTRRVRGRAGHDPGQRARRDRRQPSRRLPRASGSSPPTTRWSSSRRPRTSSTTRRSRRG